MKITAALEFLSQEIRVWGRLSGARYGHCGFSLVLSSWTSPDISHSRLRERFILSLGWHLTILSTLLRVPGQLECGSCGPKHNNPGDYHASPCSGWMTSSSNHP